MRTLNLVDFTSADLVGSVYARVRSTFVDIYYPGDVLPLPTQQDTNNLRQQQATQESKDAADTAAASAYNKLRQLKTMAPAEVQSWVAANVTNLAQAQDAIATLAIAVSILARRL